jgi:cell fate regulator YaaT (PSP1 superfamily)
MSIFPLPQFEADVKAYEQERADEAEATRPRSIVVRYGRMRHIAELPLKGRRPPGCGVQLVIRTRRGIELGTMLTATCKSSGCDKALSRDELRDYIEASGGRDYPFSEQIEVVRTATEADLSEYRELASRSPAMVREARVLAAELELDMKVVEAEWLLGGELLIFYFVAENRVDFRGMVSRLASIHHTRIEMRQVGARDEARLVADYEKCGQHCCCRQYLKVLKPVSMRAAKMQKATLDPAKISGRCGRLMCCLRYESETYEALKKNLPHKKTRVGTPAGPGIVLDGQILTQLVLVKLEENNQLIAVPLEDLCDPDACPKKEPPPPHRAAADDRGRIPAARMGMTGAGGSVGRVASAAGRTSDRRRARRRASHRSRPRRTRRPGQRRARRRPRARPHRRRSDVVDAGRRSRVRARERTRCGRHRTTMRATADPGAALRRAPGPRRRSHRATVRRGRSVVGASVVRRARAERGHVPTGRRSRRPARPILSRPAPPRRPVTLR